MSAVLCILALIWVRVDINFLAITSCKKFIVHVYVRLLAVSFCFALVDEMHTVIAVWIILDGIIDKI